MKEDKKAVVLFLEVMEMCKDVGEGYFISEAEAIHKLSK